MAYTEIADRTDNLYAASASLECCDEGASEPAVHTYCPTELLNRFCLLMAGHGRCINCSMMLGDREYAIWQLARAFATDDEELRAITTRLFPYFDEGSKRR